MSVWEVHVKEGSSMATLSLDGVEYQLPPEEAFRMAGSLLPASQHAGANKEKH